MRFKLWLVLSLAMYILRGWGWLFDSIPLWLIGGVAVLFAVFTLSLWFAFHASTEGSPPESGFKFVITVFGFIAGVSLAILSQRFDLLWQAVLLCRIAAATVPAWVIVEMLFYRDTYFSY